MASLQVVHIKLDAKAIQRYSDATFNPGDPLAVECEGRDLQRDWCDGGEDPGITVAQDEALRDLLTEGVTLQIDSCGVVTVVER